MTDSGDSDPPGKERVSLLPKATNPLADGARTVYGSDGEVDSVSARVVTAGETRRRRNNSDEGDSADGNTRTASGEDGRASRGVEGDGEETDTQCGLAYIGRKLINLLPAIGEGEEEGTTEFEEELRFGAWQVVQLIIPVTICMAVVVFFQLTVAVNITGPIQRPLYIPFDEDSNSGGVNFAFGLINALVFVVIVIIMTTVLVLLFKYKCYRAIGIWLVTASGMLLFIISSIYFVEIMDVRRLVIDWFTFAFVIWNFGVTGLMVIHWKGPLRLQQAYLITVSALVATVLIQHLPTWTTWILLAAISIYDLFAVLCPKGPLRILVETAKERGTTFFPSLIYSSTMVWITMADVEDKKKEDKKKDDKFPKSRPQKKSDSPEGSGGEDTDEDTDRAAAARDMAIRESGTHRRQQQSRSSQEEEEEEPRGFKLGLGDFIFYSVLVGKAANISEGDWVIIASCFVAILIGLCMTSLILGIVRRALPALPISIFFGLVFFFSSQHLISPFVEVLNTHQVFI